MSRSDIPELTVKDMKGLNRAIDRIKANVSILRHPGRPVKHKQRKWNMDGIVGSTFGRASYSIPMHRRIATEP